MLKIHRKNIDTKAMLDSIKELESGIVQVGHFEEQGAHPTAKDPDGAPMTFVDLMKYHAGAEPSVPRRDVLSVLVHVKNPKLVGAPYTRAFRHFFGGPATPARARDAQKMVAEGLVREEKQIFGNPKYLIASESNPDPLVDTGATKRAVTYKIKREG